MAGFRQSEVHRHGGCERREGIARRRTLNAGLDNGFIVNDMELVRVLSSFGLFWALGGVGVAAMSLDGCRVDEIS